MNESNEAQNESRNEDVGSKDFPRIVTADFGANMRSKTVGAGAPLRDNSQEKSDNSAADSTSLRPYEGVARQIVESLKRHTFRRPIMKKLNRSMKIGARHIASFSPTGEDQRNTLGNESVSSNEQNSMILNGSRKNNSSRLSQRDGGTGGMNIGKKFSPPAQAINTGLVTDSIGGQTQQQMLGNTDQPSKLLFKPMRSAELPLGNDFEIMTSDKASKNKRKKQSKNVRRIGAQQLQTVDKDSVKNTQRSDSDIGNPGSQLQKRLTPEDNEELFNLFLQMTKDPIEKQAKNIAKTEKELAEFIDETWDKDALEGIKQLRDLKDDIARQGRQLATLYKQFEDSSKMDEADNGGLSQVNEESKEQSKEGKQNAKTNVQPSITGFTDIKNMSSGSTSQNKRSLREIGLPADESSFNKIGHISHLKGTVSNSDISFFDNSQSQSDIELPDVSKSTESDKLKKSKEESKKDQKTIESVSEASEEDEATVQKSDFTGPIKRTNNSKPEKEISSLLPKDERKSNIDTNLASSKPGDYKHELALALRLFSEVDGSSHHMQEYYDLMKERSEFPLQESYFEREALDEMRFSEMTSEMKGTVKLESPNMSDQEEKKDKTRGSAECKQEKSSDMLPRGQSKGKRAVKPMTESALGGDAMSQGGRSMSSFARLADEDPMLDESYLSSKIDKKSNASEPKKHVAQNNESEAISSSYSAYSQTDSLQMYGFNAQKKVRQMSVPQIDVIHESSAKSCSSSSMDKKEQSNRPVQNQELGRSMTNKSGWLNHRDMIREDSKEQVSSSDSKQVSSENKQSTPKELGSLASQEIAEKDEDVSSQVRHSYSYERDEHRLDKDYDDTDEFVGISAITPVQQMNVQLSKLDPTELTDEVEAMLQQLPDPKLSKYPRSFFSNLLPVVKPKANQRTQTDFRIGEAQRNIPSVKMSSGQLMSESGMDAIQPSSQHPNSQSIKEIRRLKEENFKLKYKMAEIRKALMKAYEAAPDSQAAQSERSQSRYIEGLSPDHAKALYEQSKIAYDTLDLSIMMAEQRIQETRRQLQKFTKTLASCVEAEVPILQTQELAAMAICPSQAPLNTGSSNQKFDMTGTIANVFEKTLTNASSLNEHMGGIELSAGITSRETLPCLQAMIGDEDRIKRVLSLFLDHIVRTVKLKGSLQGNSSIGLINSSQSIIQVELNIVSKEPADKLQSLFANKQDLLCQVQITSNHEFDSLKNPSAISTALQMALMKKLLQQINANITSCDSRQISLQFNLQTMNLIHLPNETRSNTGSKAFVFNLMRHDCGIEQPEASMNRLNSGLFGSISSSQDRDLIGKLYGDGRQSLQWQKRPILTMSYIEVNTIKMKMDYVKAMIRRNAKKLQGIIKQQPSDEVATNKKPEPKKHQTEKLKKPKGTGVLSRNQLKQQPKPVLPAHDYDPDDDRNRTSKNQNHSMMHESNKKSANENLDRIAAAIDKQQSDNKNGTIPKIITVGEIEESDKHTKPRDSKKRLPLDKIYEKASPTQLKKNGKKIDNRLAKRDSSSNSNSGSSDSRSNDRSQKSGGSVYKVIQKHRTDQELNPIFHQSFNTINPNYSIFSNTMAPKSGRKKVLNKRPVILGRNLYDRSNMSFTRKSSGNQPRRYKTAQKKSTDTIPCQNSDGKKRKQRKPSPVVKSVPINDIEEEEKEGPDVVEDLNGVKKLGKRKRRQSMDQSGISQSNSDISNEMRAIRQQLKDAQKNQNQAEESSPDEKESESVKTGESEEFSIELTEGVDPDRQRSVAAMKANREFSALNQSLGGSIADPESAFGGTIFRDSSQMDDESSENSDSSDSSKSSDQSEEEEKINQNQHVKTQGDFAEPNLQPQASKRDQAIRIPRQNKQAKEKKKLRRGISGNSNPSFKDQNVSNTTKLEMEAIQEASSDDQTSEQKDELSLGRIHSIAKSITSLRNLQPVSDSSEAEDESESEECKDKERERKKRKKAVQPAREAIGFNMLMTGKTTQEMNNFKEILTKMEKKLTSEGIPAKKCKKLLMTKKGKDALVIVDETLVKLTKAIESAQKEQVSELSATMMIDKANQEQIDLIVLDMQVTDLDPIKLCQKIKEAYRNFQITMKTFVKCPRILAVVDSQVKVANNVMIQMGQAGIEHSIEKPFNERKAVELMQYL